METVKKYAVPGLIALVMALAVAAGRGLFAAQSLQAAMMALSDACFVPGAFLTGVSLLGWIGAQGTFDTFGYAIGKFSLHTLLPGRDPERSKKTFFDYKKERDARGRRWSLPMLVVGLVCLALGGVFLAVYYMAQ